MSGPATMRNLGGEAEKRRLEDEQQEAKKEARKRLAIEKKETAEREAAELEAAFALCEAGCVGGGRAMPMGRLEAVPGMRAQEGPVQGVSY